MEMNLDYTTDIIEPSESNGQLNLRSSFVSLILVASPGVATAAHEYSDESVNAKVSEQSLVSTPEENISQTHVKQSITEIRELFGFNVTEVAEVFKKERPTIYNWIKSEQVKTEVSAKLLAMVAVAQHWVKVEGENNLSFLLDYKGPKANDISIREALKEETLDADLLTNLIDTRYKQYNEASAISREIIGEVELAKGSEIPEGTRRLNKLWTESMTYRKNTRL